MCFDFKERHIVLLLFNLSMTNTIEETLQAHPNMWFAPSKWVLMLLLIKQSLFDCSASVQTETQSVIESIISSALLLPVAWKILINVMYVERYSITYWMFHRVSTYYLTLHLPISLTNGGNKLLNICTILLNLLLTIIIQNPSYVCQKIS